MRAKRILIMAGGTGGHVMPALAIAQYLSRQGVGIYWMGTRQGIEQRLVPGEGYPLLTISMVGLRGKGLLNGLLLPLRLSFALLQALYILLKIQPQVVLGMGGFVSFPGGVVARLIGIPLLIHEQNAIAGTSNRYLAPLAAKVMQAFPHTFTDKKKILFTGNPVRRTIEQVYYARQPFDCAQRPALNLLVFGGSQGSTSLNRIVPEAILELVETSPFSVVHQTGMEQLASTQARYQSCQSQVRLEPFIEDMAAVYRWADVVICRSGAMTIAELTAVGVGSILIPFPYATDDHQTANARYLSDKQAACLVPESELSVECLVKLLADLHQHRNKITDMAEKARQLFNPKATEQIADQCMEYIDA